MKTFQADQIKSIALLGNSGSGKTTLAEAMLFNGGIIERRGTIEGKNTVSDYRPIEHENGNSIFSTVLYTEFQNKKLNILYIFIIISTYINHFNFFKNLIKNIIHT